jgi:hypothetical protein
MAVERNRHLDEDLCLDLLLGQLSTEDSRWWGEHLVHCAACEELVRVRSAQLETRRAGLFPRRERDGRLTLSPRPEPMRPSRKRPIRRIVTPALVAAAALVFFFLWQGRQSAQAPFGVFWIDRNLEELVTRSGGGPSAGLQEGLRAYARHDAQRAAELLERAQVGQGLDEIRRLYLASALLHLGRVDQSIGLLRELEPMTLPSPWRDDALWTLHAALIQGGQTVAADSLLAEMAHLPGKTGQRAKRLREP